MSMGTPDAIDQMGENWKLQGSLTVPLKTK
jgi:hypothetical protein